MPYPLFAQQTVGVDPVTGRLQCAIPLWTLEHGGIHVPIGVVNNGGAQKVTDGEGAIGVGWNLQAGGAVRRTTRGLPDDYPGGSSDLRRGWLFDNNAQVINNFTPTADDNLAICTDEVNDYNFINGLGYTKDSEPDMFSFEAPGLSGSFVFGTDGAPKLVPYQDVKIAVKKNSAGQITAITITDNSGMVYDFSVQETTRRRKEWFKTGLIPSYFLSDFNYYLSELSFVNAWHLASITAPGGAQVTFSYSQYGELPGAKFYTAINENNTYDTLYYLSDKVTAMKLLKIDGGVFSVKFMWDLTLLKNILVQESTVHEMRQFNFVYESHRSQANINYYPFVDQNFLKEIRQDVDCVPFPSYQFHYAGVTTGNELVYFSADRENRMDIWEYFNDGAWHNIPTVYYYANATGAERFRTEPNAGATPTSTLAGENRSADLSMSTFGALTSIAYPSGGFSLIAWEPNQYYDAVANVSLIGGGVRVKTISTHGGEMAFGQSALETNKFHTISKNYEYLLADGKASGKVIYHPALAFATGSVIVRGVTHLADDRPEILYSMVTEKIAGRGKTVFEFNVPAMYPATTDTDWKATRSNIARMPGGSCAVGNLKNGPYTFPFPPNTNYDFERGLPSRVAEYSESNVLLDEHIFVYNRNPSTNTIIKGLRFERIGDAFHYGQYEVLTGTNKARVTETHNIFDEVTPANRLTSVTTYAYSTVHALLESITTVNSDGATYKERFKYVKDFASITSPLGDPAIALSKLLTANRTGLIVEDIKSVKPAGQTESVVGSSLTLYKDFGRNQVQAYQQLALPQNATFTESAIAVNGTNQQFTSDTDYIPQTIIDTYDALGNAVDVHDNNKNSVTYLYGYTGLTPIATLANAQAAQVAFQGFETTTGYDWTGPSLRSYVAGWTGERALVMPTTTTLEKSTVSKGTASVYRLSCWVKSSTAANLTLKILNGTTLIASAVLVYPAASANTWKYLEGQVSVAAAPATFKAQLTTSAGVSIDDILLIPAGATFKGATYKPLTGITSQTNDQGKSTTFQYDPLGRLLNTYDQDRNLVEVKEYQYQNQPPVALNAFFSSSPWWDKIQKSQAVTFTADPNCLTVVSYAWKVNDVLTSTASTCTVTFNTVGNQRVELTITAASGSVTHATDFCVLPGPPAFALAVDRGTIINKCDATYTRTFSAKVLPRHDCHETYRQYQWSYNSGAGWISVDDSSLFDETLVFDISEHGTPKSYDIKCDVTSDCGIEKSPCIVSSATVGTKTISITFNNPPQVCP
jgi:YD repeat-containing protein